MLEVQTNRHRRKIAAPLLTVLLMVCLTIFSFGVCFQVVNCADFSCWPWAPGACLEFRFSCTQSMEQPSALSKMWLMPEYAIVRGSVLLKSPVCTRPLHGLTLCFGRWVTSKTGKHTMSSRTGRPRLLRNTSQMACCRRDLVAASLPWNPKPAGLAARAVDFQHLRRTLHHPADAQHPASCSPRDFINRSFDSQAAQAVIMLSHKKEADLVENYSYLDEN